MEAEGERRTYDHIKCPVCAVPWFDYGPLRWPIHSKHCAGHRSRALTPHPLKKTLETVVNLPAELKPKLDYVSLDEAQYLAKGKTDAS